MKKRGFTLVELIVVIAIILVLSAALVPQLVKYVERAKQSNCQLEASAIFSQVRADYAASLAEERTGVTVDFKNGVTYQDVTVTLDEDLAVEKVPLFWYAAKAGTKKAVFNTSDGTMAGKDITIFIYSNEEYMALWNLDGELQGWTVAPTGCDWTHLRQ